MKKLLGKVLSDKMQKTVVVGVETFKMHPLYHKRQRRMKKYYAQNDLGAKAGDKVLIVHSRPFSKLKSFKVVEIVKN